SLVAMGAEARRAGGRGPARSDRVAGPDGPGLPSDPGPRAAPPRALRAPRAGDRAPLGALARTRPRDPPPRDRPLHRRPPADLLGAGVGAVGPVHRLIGNGREPRLGERPGIREMALNEETPLDEDRAVRPYA